MKIAFLGDIALNDDYNILYHEDKKPFKEIGKFLSQHQYVVGNLECLSEGSYGENLLKKPRLKTKPETLNYLLDIGINVAQLAHNHVYDNLKDGFDRTIHFLDSQCIRHMGASTEPGKEKHPLLLTYKNISITLLNYVTQDTNPKLPENADVFLNYFEEERVISDIQKHKKSCNFVFILLHWGGRVESGSYPDWDQPKTAKRLIDAGADLIIGNHTHTIQPYEKYKGKYIFYSLGNFCFSDIHFEGRVSKMSRKRNSRSLIPIVNIDEDSKELTIRIEISQKESDLSIKLIKKSLWRQYIIYKLIFQTKLIWNLYYWNYRKISPIVHFIFSGEFLSRKITFEKIIKHIKK